METLSCDVLPETCGMPFDQTSPFTLDFAGLTGRRVRIVVRSRTALV